jgi:hypothetical protein
MRAVVPIRSVADLVARRTHLLPFLRAKVAKHCGARRAEVPRSGTKAGEAPSVSPVLDFFVSFVPSCEKGIEVSSDNESVPLLSRHQA